MKAVGNYIHQLTHNVEAAAFGVNVKGCSQSDCAA